MGATSREGAALAFGVLGPLTATYAGVGLPLGGRQQRAVLAQLVCEAGHALPVERLVDDLWHEEVPPGAITTVQTYVFHLRQLLEPERPRGSPGRTLVTVPGGYRLDVDRGCLDLARFEDGVAAGDAAMAQLDPAGAETAYRAALSLWRGEVLDDLADYAFVGLHRARLDELRASAQQSRIQAELDLGQHLAVVGDVGVLLGQHPLREGLHAQRILALYRSGRQSDALSAYRELRSVLDTELGIEPSPPLQELNTRMLRQDPTLGWTPPVRSAPARVVVPASPPPAAQDPHPSSAVVEGQRRRLPAVAVVVVAVAALAGGAGLPAIETFSASPAVPANSVSELDASGNVIASVPVGTNPVAVATTPGEIWVVNASDDTVSRINADTHAVQTIDVGDEPRAIAVTGDDLWVTNFRDGTISRLNVDATHPTQTIDVGSGPDAIAYGPAGLWVANSGDDTIRRIDTETGGPEDPIDVGDGPDGLAVDDVSVWVANGRGGTVSRVSAQTGSRMDEIRVDSGPRGIVRLGGDVWVADELSQNVSRIDVASGHDHELDAGDGPTALAALGGRIWVTEKYAADLLSIDPDGEAVDRVELNAAVSGVAVADGHLWVAAGAVPSAEHRGGTLRVAAVDLPGTFSANSLDPARVYDLSGHEAIRMVYDGLLAYHYSSADPQLLVPDLARSVPEPADGGLTYIFHLRPGIRYSNGVEVLPSDFVLGVQRALFPGAARPDFFSGLVGAHACPQHRSACDLSRGVVADDAAGTVTFHLVAPDPEFLYKLTLLVVPAPPGTSLRKIKTPAIPGTGPYRIATYVPGRALRMTRNPYFTQWSAAAQPAGFVDVVTWVNATDVREAADAVVDSSADLTELTPLSAGIRTPRGLVDDMLVNHPGLVDRGRSQGTSFVVLNSGAPPFSDVRARRALNYAVDRTKVVQLLGGTSVDRATCQLMPPTMPSYQPYCPYSSGAPDDDPSGPDLGKARRLVRRSGTYGMPVTVTDIVGDYNTVVERYVARVLWLLDYDVTLDRLRPNYRNYYRFYSPDSGFQVVTGGWYADYPLPSNFYELITCGDKPEGWYQFHYCDEKLDRRAAAATANLQTRPGKALRAWTRIERDLTDGAPLVALANPINWWITSQRVGNYQTGAEGLGPLMSQLWVQ